MRAYRLARLEPRWRQFVLSFYRDKLVENLALVTSVVLAFALANDWNGRQEEFKEAGQQQVLLERLAEEVRRIATEASDALYKARLDIGENAENPAAVSCGSDYARLGRLTGFKETIWSSEKVLLLGSIKLPASDSGGGAKSLAEEIDEAYRTIGEVSLMSSGNDCVSGLGEIATAFSNIQRTLEGTRSEVVIARENRLHSRSRETVALIARYILIWLGFLSLPALAYVAVLIVSRMVHH